MNVNRRAKRAAAKSALAGLLTFAFAMAVPSIAAAQDPTFYLDRLRIAGAPDDGIGVWRPQMGEQTRFFGQLGVGFSLNPLRVENYVDTIDQSAIVEEQNGHPVETQLTTYFSAGVEILERFSFQLSFPLAVYETGNSVCNTTALICPSIRFQSTAPMDLRLDGRVVFFRNEAKTIKLGAQAALWFPTGDPFSFAGDNSLTGSLGVSAEYDAKLFAITLNTGYHFRPTHTFNELTVGDELIYGAGVYVPLMDGRFRVSGEVTGSLGTTPDSAGDANTPPLKGNVGDVDNLPIEWRVEGRMGLGSDPSQMWVGLSGGTRVTAGYAPDFRSVLVFGGWFPVSGTKPKQRGFQYVIPADTDGDKLPDDIDMCPAAREDGKGANPDDGCPEMLNDADSDGIFDAQDACPHEPGPPNADPEKNGCPENIRRAKGSDQIEILREIPFAFDRADLLKEAYPTLNEVVRLLKVNPDILLVRIEGHTDDIGTLKYNDDLSQARAESVRRYLIERGIAEARLEAKGWGKRRPIVDNSTAEGRQKNRRVEFHIVKTKGTTNVQGAPPTDPNPPVDGAPTDGSTPPARPTTPPAQPTAPPTKSSTPPAKPTAPATAPSAPPPAPAPSTTPQAPPTKPAPPPK